MKRAFIAVMALFAGAAPAAVMAATDSKSKSTTTTTTKAKTTTTTTRSRTTTTTSTTTSTTTKPTLIGGTTVLDATKSPIVPPSCAPNSGCFVVLTRVTAIPTIRDGVAYPTKVKVAGDLVAFTLGLAQIPKSSQTPHQVIAGLDATYGGTTQAGITVLKPGPGKNSSRFYSVVAQSPVFHLQPYLGYNVEFPLTTPIPVTPGEVVALTVPTWATVISYNLPPKSFAYRQSRKSNCPHTGHYDNAQIAIGQGTNYKCDYPGSRLEYNVTEVATPPPPKSYVH